MFEGLCIFKGDFLNFWTKDDGFIGGIYKITATSALIFSVWAYFNTIHPVFQKEKELQTAQSLIKDLEVRRADISKDIEELQIEVSNKELELAKANDILIKTREYADEKTKEMERFQQKMNLLNKHLVQTRKEAVQTILSAALDKISKRHLDLYIAEKYRGRSI